ncbi:MAG: succinate dehydrogenase assembly factor 2 [Proteobacteria bacterium]|nr:succinate dehydrogenase assembly factor 2 [Pseudomonadota bacterium]
MSQEPAEGDLGRTLWRCRRGMKELDLLLERYGRSRLPQAPEATRRSFERLLELPDPLLAGYFLGGIEPPDAATAELVRQIRAYVA